MSYNYRIMAALPGHTPVEITRSNGIFHMRDWHRWVRDMGAAWECWLEGRMTDSRCITPRVKFARPSGSEKNRVYLTAEEKVGAGI